MAPWEPSYLPTTNPGYPNETEAQEEDFKFNLMKLIKAFKEDMNKFLKEIITLLFGSEMFCDTEGA